MNIKLDAKINNFIDSNGSLNRKYIFKCDRSGTLSIVKRNSILTFFGRLFSSWSGSSYQLEVIRKKFGDKIQPVNNEEQRVIRALNNRITRYNKKHSSNLSLINITQTKIQNKLSPLIATPLPPSNLPSEPPKSSASSLPPKEKNIENIDPITNMEIEKGEPLILVNNVRFSADSLARYMMTNKNDNFFTRSDGTQVIIWRNQEEYLDILNRLLPLLKDPELIQQIQVRIEGYPLAKGLIDDFNRLHPDFSFGSLLACLYAKMSDSGVLGANFITGNQGEGFNAYYRLRNCLPEKMMKVIFPFYAYSPGDPNCIGSASRVLSSQISRLELLDLSKASKINAERALDKDIEPYILWFEERFLVAPPVSVTEDISRIGPITSMKAIQFVEDGNINIGLRYVSMEAGTDLATSFAIALMEKFEKSPLSFSKAQPMIANILNGTLPTDEKKRVVKRTIEELVATHANLELLKEACNGDRSLFRAIRKAAFPDKDYGWWDTPPDEVIWAQVEKNPDLIRPFLTIDNPNLVSIVVKQFFGVEIPVSELSEGNAFRQGGSEFPQVMFDKRDKQFKLLLSVIP